MQTICMDGQCFKNYLKMALRWKKPEFNESFIKNYDEDSDKGYILKVDVKYPKRLYNIHCNLPFLPDRIKINKCNKFVCNLYEKNTMFFT